MFWHLYSRGVTSEAGELLVYQKYKWPSWLIHDQNFQMEAAGSSSQSTRARVEQSLHMKNSVRSGGLITGQCLTKSSFFPHSFSLELMDSSTQTCWILPPRGARGLLVESMCFRTNQTPRMGQWNLTTMCCPISTSWAEMPLLHIPNLIQRTLNHHEGSNNGQYNHDVIVSRTEVISPRFELFIVAELIKSHQAE